MRRKFVDLPPLAPGIVPRLSVMRFGEASRGPKIYVQGALHADEAPGTLAAHRLAERLADLPEEAICGEIVIVPVANPIGLSQRVLGLHLGRYALEDGRNFNRGYPDVTDAVIAALAGKLGMDEAQNTALLKSALASTLAAQAPVEPVPALKHALLSLAIDADWVFDLHCDAEALPHLYTQPGFVAEFEPFTRLMGRVRSSPPRLRAITPSMRQSPSCGSACARPIRCIPSGVAGWRPRWNCAGSRIPSRILPRVMPRRSSVFSRISA